MGPRSSRFGGRVEVCVELSWTTICDETWDNLDASVICFQLGFSRYGKVAFAQYWYLHVYLYNYVQKIQGQFPLLDVTLKDSYRLEYLTYTVMELRIILLPALIMKPSFIIASHMMMLESFAKVLSLLLCHT